ncbi:MAG: Rnf-Nqr domain containing protein [Phycisphaerae bacterium]|jgi:electron transport complex protein RnfA|nr:Rnf-Nqr domain containing protein [Phycisphaerae bacterium]
MEVGFLTLGISSILINNFVLARFLGLCPFLGVSKKTGDSVGMGLAVIFVMTLASTVTAAIYRYVLLPPVAGRPNLLAYFGFAVPEGGYVLILKTVSYILVIAVLVQFVEMVLKKAVPALYRSLGIYLPLITTNCAVMGVALLNTTDWKGGEGLPVHLAAWNGFCAGLGFLVAMLLMSGIRERLATCRVPKALAGLPIAFICAGLMALAFMGFGKLFGIQI